MQPAQVAVVAIGRNEGLRLRRCLLSVVETGHVIVTVYVDSGSTDGSCAMARELGCDVVDLDLATPFTAARARNEGFARALQLAPELTHVQFVDGDCEIVSGWLQAALDFLVARPDVVAVSGRRRERYPQRSLYNRLCDFEWDKPAGETRECGGDVMIRADAFQAVGGYLSSLIAGEEPELCVRLRAAGGRIWRLDQEMTLHDAAMLHFSQWWSRSKRAGFAFAEGAALHGAPPERHWVRESHSVWFWGLVLPLVILVLVLTVSAWALLLMLSYPLQILRLGLVSNTRSKYTWLRSAFWVFGKFPEVVGQIRFVVERLLGRRNKLIEYK